jgi:hypothetical protein
MLRKALLVLMLAVLAAGPALAQTDPPTPPEVPPEVPGAPGALGVDAEGTREQLSQLLERHPHDVGRVLALSPSLIGNEPFMASYPALQAFFVQHPEVAANPQYYFARYNDSHYSDSSSPELNFLAEFLAVLAGIVCGVFAVLMVAWLIKTLIEQRRWSRLQRVQAEVHQKVLDRLASNEQLLAYMETPAGRRFLESAPIPIEGPRPVSAPFNRVLWSMQVGVLGVATLSIGIGFALSSLASIFLSRRLGLASPQPQTSTEL